MVEFLNSGWAIKLLTLFALACCFNVVRLAEARVRVYKWEVKYEFKSPDCYRKLAITINGKTPGPSIIAQQGDTIVVELKNSLLTENVAIHWHGIRQSILIQGRGKFNCSTPGIETARCNSSNPECVPYALTVVPNKTYRLRIGSLTALSALSFEIEGHNMTVVEADGHYVNPFVVKNLFIYSGETYSVLVTADQNPSRNYWATAKIVSRNSSTPAGLAVLNYYPNHPRRAPPTSPPVGPAWNDVGPRLAQSVATRAHPAHVHAPPRAADRTIVMLNTQNRVDGRVRWSVNNVSFNLPHTPYLIAYRQGLLGGVDRRAPPDNYADLANYDIYSVARNVNASVSNGAYRLRFNSTVDVILQNANTMVVNNSETHPWHLHGHDFWVVGYGSGKFDAGRDPAGYNLVDPIMKNTVAVHPYGWTAVRFRADNPGVWAFHCHIESHFYMGMGVVFESGVERVGKLPESIMGCGEARIVNHGRP
ncbi:ascorbate oxidase [Striga asiatica]|uniref:L-ascorbate oxidase n=1 Tax=Striga asiatica TaxID=4170 RepID=A0A5A7QQV9_STRAF|nr:ascorbate oxidase [Striga asiatica]